MTLPSPRPQIWCGAGVNLSGGRTKDGGSIVGASVFYGGDEEPPQDAPKDEIERLSLELKVRRKGGDQKIFIFRLIIIGDMCNKYSFPFLLLKLKLYSFHLLPQESEDRVSSSEERLLSSLVWICTSTHAISKVRQ